MNWNYSEFEVDRSHFCPAGVMFRPVVNVGLSASKDSVYLRALIDTGADQSIVPFSVAERIGAELFEDEQNSVEGISGQGVIVVPGRVRIELFDGRESIDWIAIIGFAKFPAPENECSVLGHAGCLEYFHAAFDGVDRFVELTLRGELPHTA